MVSYTTLSPLLAWKTKRAVCSLLRFLSGHPGRTLSAIVLCGARKFLSSFATAATIEESHIP
ncbi:hypothetical protein KIMH_09100 [Bombiscardovia apis]|uniref:Uncharacterized protein n=1 Tax=Bombiscardovia apis TaxID=2932182 RepID=A0ABN6SFK6_9BIFI|nr:hypothetical protein KIMH_09100 [Bombiscardovia apis]